MLGKKEETMIKVDSNIYGMRARKMLLTEIKNKRLGVKRDRRKIKSCLDRLILDDNEIYTCRCQVGSWI